MARVPVAMCPTARAKSRRGAVQARLVIVNKDDAGRSPVGSSAHGLRTPLDHRAAVAVNLRPSCVGLGRRAVAHDSKPTSPAAGATSAVEWTLTGDLLPAASGSVSFAVEIESSAGGDAHALLRRAPLGCT